MLFAQPSIVSALDARIDIVARGTGQSPQRTASYDGGATWPGGWRALGDSPGGLAGTGGTDEAQDHAVALASSGDGQVMHLVGRSRDTVAPHDRFAFLRRSVDFGATWSGWAQIGLGEFTGALAVACSGNGQRLFVAGRGNDGGIYLARSVDAGASFEVAWARIGSGKFLDFGPAVACSADGRRVFLTGIGLDKRVWYALSDDGGNQWAVAWAPILEGVMTSGAAAVCSADGRRLRVFGRGSDNRIWLAGSDDGCSSWVGWAPVPEGTGFTSAPAAALSWDGRRLHLCALGGDRRVWRAHSADGGATWPLAWAPVGTLIF